MTSAAERSLPRHEADERPAPLASIGLSAQSALLAVAPIALFPVLLVQAVDGSEDYANWSVFTMLVINGAATIFQAFRVGPIGSGMTIIPYPSPTTIPFCILAFQQGGVGTLAALVLVSGVFQLVLSLRLVLLRRIVTPAISGAILILLLLSLVPVLFRNLAGAPADAPSYAAPLCLFVTFAVIVGLLVKGATQWRVWASILGVAAGSVAAVVTGIFDFEPVSRAPVAGLPLDGWPGLAFSFDPAFWSLLPVFLFLSVIGVLQGSSITLATQRVSWRGPQAMDYRRVQGATSVTGLANAIGGLAAVMPVAISPRGTAFAQQTGCASRYVGAITGVLLILAAIFPKSWSLLLGIPAPVVAIYILILVAPLVVEGMKLIIQDAPDYRTSLVLGTAILVGLGLQTELVSLPVGEVWEAVLQRALTGGGVVLVLLTAFLEFRRQRRRSLRVALDTEELPRLNEFMAQLSAARGWNKEMTDRLQAVSEETLLILLEGQEAGREGRRRLLVNVANVGPAVEIEFISLSAGGDNLEDRIALLSQPMSQESEIELPEMESIVERDAAVRLLRHYASSVSHRQYFDAEIITVRVSPPAD